MVVRGGPSTYTLLFSINPVCVLFSGCCLQSLNRWISAATWLSSSCYHTRSLRRGLRFYRNSTPIHPVFISHVYFLKQISSFSVRPTLLSSIVRGEEKKRWEIPKHHRRGGNWPELLSPCAYSFHCKSHSVILKTWRNRFRCCKSYTSCWCFGVLRLMGTNIPIVIKNVAHILYSTI